MRLPFYELENPLQGRLPNHGVITLFVGKIQQGKDFPLRLQGPGLRGVLVS